MKKIILLLFPLLCSCNGKTTLPGNSDSCDVDTTCLCPHATIVLQPYDNFTRKEAEKLVPVLQKHFDRWLYGNWNFIVNNPAPLPKTSFIASKNRYDVTPILNYERSIIKGDEIIVGLTHRDICTDSHGHKNYGIVGMSRLGNQVCLISDKRLSNKSDYWKVILHEFIHTFYSGKHCPNDDPTCFMKDAKGHGNFHKQNRLCDSCRRD